MSERRGRESSCSAYPCRYQGDQHEAFAQASCPGAPVCSALSESPVPARFDVSSRLLQLAPTHLEQERQVLPKLAHDLLP